MVHLFNHVLCNVDFIYYGSLFSGICRTNVNHMEILSKVFSRFDVLDAFVVAID